MRRYLTLLISISVFVIHSCKEDDSAKPNVYAAKLVSQLNVTDTFLFNFPLENGQFDTIAMSYLRWQEGSLKLPSLQKGFDSLQIRIWYGCDMSGDRLVRLIHDGKNWKAELSELIKEGGGNEGEAKLTDISFSRTIQTRSPESGWIKFIDSLFKLKILTLPNEYDIPNFDLQLPTDGCGVGIEIATKNAYRCYAYRNPDIYDYWQTKNVVQILKLLSAEFNITQWPERPPEKRNDKVLKNRKDSVIKIRELTLPEDTINSTRQRQ